MFEDVQKKLASLNEEGEISPRQPLIALVLSICPGLGQHYAGHMLRGITAYATLILVSWVAAILFMYAPRILSLPLLALPFIYAAGIAADAYFCAARQPRGYVRQWFNQTRIYIAVFALLVVTVNPLMDYLVGGRIVRAFFVTSASMAPTVLEHDLVLTNKLTTPRKGDIVLVDFSKGTMTNRVTKVIKDQLLRRFIAGPGDMVEIVGQEVLVNGEALSEPYATFGTGSSHDMFNTSDYHFGPEKVPADSFFVLSDARNFGLDSRTLGSIDKNEIGGIATKVFWSWNLDEGSFQWSRTAMSLR